MVKHVLFCKLKERTQENAEALRDKFLTMKGRVPVAVDVNAACDFLGSERSYDVILEVTLNSREDLAAYQADEYHCGVIKPYVHSVRESSATVDYEY